jgi:hypothetical protein
MHPCNTSEICVLKYLIKSPHRYCTYARYPVLLNKTVQKNLTSNPSTGESPNKTGAQRNGA